MSLEIHFAVWVGLVMVAVGVTTERSKNYNPENDYFCAVEFLVIFGGSLIATGFLIWLFKL